MTATTFRHLAYLVIGTACLGFLSGLWLLFSIDGLNTTRIFLTQYITHEIPGSLLYILIAILAFPLARHIGSPDPLLRYIARNPAAISAGLLAVLIAGSIFVYHDLPLTIDEFAPLFQARVFAEGRLYGMLPPGLGKLLTPGALVISPVTGAVHSQYLPGFSFLLTPFVKAGAAWLLNPLIGVGILLVIRHLAHRIYGDELATGWAMLFTLASPAFTLNAASYYALNAQMLGCLIFTALVLEDAPRGMLAAGAVLGFSLVLHQPPRPLLYALPWLGWIALQPGRAKKLAAIAIGALPFILVLGLGWYQLSSVEPRPENLPIASHEPRSLFEVITITLRGATNVDPVAMLWNRWLGLNKFIAWAAPGLPVLAFLGWLRRRGEQRVTLLALSLVVTFTGYLLVRADQGHGWGFRYLQAAWGGLPLLAAGFLTGKGSQDHFSEHAGVSLSSYAATLALLGLVLGNGLQAWTAEKFISQHLEQLPEAEPGKHQVLFLRPWAGYYSGDLVQNDPFLRSPIIYLVSPSLFVEGAIMAHYFPGAEPRMKEMFDPVWILPAQPDWAPTLTPPAQWPIRLLQPPDLKKPTSPGS